MAAARLDELDLPYLPVDSTDFAENPVRYLAAAREKHLWLAKCEHGLVVHGYDALLGMAKLESQVLLEPPHARLVELVGGKGTRWGDFLEHSIQALSGEEHQRLRDLVAPAFTPRQANLRRELMQKVVNDLLDAWIPRGAFNFEEFASYFPVSVMCRLIGAPLDMLPHLRPSLEALGQGFTTDPELLTSLQGGYAVMHEFVEQLVRARKSGLRELEDPDLLDSLLDVHGSGGLSEDELIDLLIFLFVAGYDTSKNALTLTMYTLLNNPAMYERCGRDKDYCRSVIDETMRFLGVASGAKVLTADVEFDGVIMPAGTLVFLIWSVAGRDPNAFDRPDDFLPERSGKNRLAFGAGPHMCLGQFLARTQLEEGLHQIARRVKNPRLAGEIGWRPFIGVWGLRGLPIEFDIDGAPVAAAQ